MPYQVLPLIHEMFQRIGPGLPFAQRMAIANPWLFENYWWENWKKTRAAML